MERRSEKMKGVLVFLGNITVSLLFLFFTYRLWEKDFHTPIVYSGGDGVGALVTIQKAIQGRGFFDFDFFCAPYGETLYSQDYFFQYILIKFITIFTSDVGVVSNIFWIFTYILTAITTYIFLKKLGCTWPTIIVGSTIYNFLPYHYFRLEHFWLMGYYIVPLVGYMVLEMLEEQKAEPDKKGKKEFLIRIFFAFMIGLNGLYYSVFSIMVLSITLFYTLLYKKRRCVISKYLTDCIGIAIPIVILYVIPLVIFGAGEVSNISSGRDISQINTFGLNLALLFLPIPGHRIPLLNDFTQYCYEQMNVFTENYMVSLGLVLGVGTVVAVLFAFKKTEIGKWQDRIRDFGILTLIIFIVATAGGLDNFIGIFISASIRCYNRLSIFIALFAAATVCLLLEQIRKWSGKCKWNYLFVSICAAIAVIGVLDTTSPMFSKYETYEITEQEYICNYDDIKEEYDNDIEFFEKVNMELDEQKMLFIAPYNSDLTKFWEDGYFHRIKTFVVQPEIQTSYSFFDEDFASWWTNLSETEMETQMKLMAVLGYSGILIDKTSFAGENQMYDYIDSLNGYIDESSLITSANGNLCFYSIKEWKKEFLSQYTEKEIKQWKNDIYLDMYTDYSYVDRNELYGLTDDNVVEAGQVQFGPYASLEAGTYQIVLTGSNLSDVNVKVTTDSGIREVLIDNIEISDDHIQYEFSLEEKEDEIEFLAQGKEDFRIDSYCYAVKRDETFDLWETLQAERRLRKEFGLGIFVKDIPLDSFKIKGDGKIAANGILLNDNAVQYGPYFYLEEGIYQVTVQGQGLNDADFRVTAENGRKTIDYKIVEQTDTKLVYGFRLYEPQNGIEFLIESNKNGILIDKYELERENLGNK